MNSNHKDSSTLFNSLHDVLKAAQVILERAGMEGNQLVIALDKIFQSYTGKSALQIAGINLKEYLTPAQLAERLGLGKGRKGARRMNKLLKEQGFQYWAGDHWEPTEKGKPYAFITEHP